MSNNDPRKQVVYLQKENNKIKAENIALRTNWESLKNWLSPGRCKPLYWDYMTAKSVISTMENLVEEGGER